MDVVEEAKVKKPRGKKASAKVLEESAEIVEAVPKKVYKDEDLIECMSVTKGILTHTGRRSKNFYKWLKFNDVIELEVRDINALRAVKSNKLYAPEFIILDEEFLQQDRYKELKEFYDSILYKDLTDLINLPIAQFKQNLNKLPKGFVDALAIKASELVKSGQLDSIAKMDAIDAKCGTDLKLLIK